MPNVKSHRPWREWDLLSRENSLKYAEDAGITIDMKHKTGGALLPWMPTPCTHRFRPSLENPSAEAEESMALTLNN